MQVPSIDMLQRRLYPCQSGSVVAMLHAVEKTFLVAQPIQLIALTSPEAHELVVFSGGHSKRRKPAGKGAKGTPPRREVQKSGLLRARPV